MKDNTVTASDQQGVTDPVYITMNGVQMFVEEFTQRELLMSFY